MFSLSRAKTRFAGGKTENGKQRSFISYQERKQIAADLKLVYAAATAQEARSQLELLLRNGTPRYPLIAQSWRANWTRIELMFGFPAEIRRAVYTTDVIESLNMSLRKITKTRAAFPSDEAAFKIIWLGLRNTLEKMDDANSQLETSIAAVCNHFRGSSAARRIRVKEEFTQNS